MSSPALRIPRVNLLYQPQNVFAGAFSRLCPILQHMTRKYAMANVAAGLVLAWASAACGQAPSIKAVLGTLYAPGTTGAMAVYSLQEGTVIPLPAGPGQSALRGSFPSLHTVQAFIAGVPTACVFHIWGSVRIHSEASVFPQDYADLSGPIDCTASGTNMVHLAYKPIAQLVIQLTAFAGATSVTFSSISTN